MADEEGGVFIPCLITGLVVLFATIGGHVFLYMKLLDMSKKRYSTP